jgi:AcrR family transcriptional regulator
MDDIDLPDSIQLAWGVRERPSRGPKRGLSLERIVAAAVRVAATEGLAAVSMSRVASELGTAPMSLYRYLNAKDELLELMVDAAGGLPPAPLAEGETWRDGLARWAASFREVLRRHPWILRVPITGPPTTPNQVAWMEHGLACMRETGLAEGEKLQVILLLSGFVRSEALLAADVRGAAEGGGGGWEAALPAYGRLLNRLTDPERFPAVRALIAAGVFDEPDDPNAEFSFGVERLLDGVGVLVRARADAP